MKLVNITDDFGASDAFGDIIQNCHMACEQHLGQEIPGPLKELWGEQTVFPSHWELGASTLILSLLRNPDFEDPPGDEPFDEDVHALVHGDWQEGWTEWDA